MRQIIIHDDFYSNPIEIRQLALQTDFQKERLGHTYPGANSYHRHYIEEMTEFFSYTCGERVAPIMTAHTGGFRSQLKKDGQGRQYIHVDIPNPNCTWAAVCYLSLPEHYTKEDGTFYDSGSKFWKHKKTGMECLPYDTAYLSTIGMNGYDDLRNFMETDGVDENKWICTMSVPIKFNRVIVFRSNLWHSQGELFGTDINNGRLIQTFFFESVKQ